MAETQEVGKVVRKVYPVERTNKISGWGLRNQPGHDEKRGKEDAQEPVIKPLESETGSNVDIKI